MLSITTMAQQNYKNESLTIGIRVKDLLAKLTLKEKASLLGYRSEAVPRRISPLITGGMKDYMVYPRAGEATVFPQAIALAATFNPELVKSVSNVISTEARAK